MGDRLLDGVRHPDRDTDGLRRRHLRVARRPINGDAGHRAGRTPAGRHRRRRSSPTGWRSTGRELVNRRPLTAEALRKRGERLLSQSAETGRDETLHHAYPFIIDELAADEARILWLLATDGKQAYMDVRDRGYVPFTTEPVAEHMAMVGTDAGCRHPDRTPVYLRNLERLGLITFEQNPADDLKRYQVLEAQPHIEAAHESARRLKTVYGRFCLTDLGVEFCETCLPVSVDLERSRARFRRESNE